MMHVPRLGVALLSCILAAAFPHPVSHFQRDALNIGNFRYGLGEKPPTTNAYNLPPSQDEWYTPPADWEGTAPGAVLRVREHAYPTINIKNTLDTFQVLYRTEDTNGDKSWAVATVFIPVMHAGCPGYIYNGTNTTNSTNTTGNGWCAHGVVSYQVPTDSVSPDAAPSYLLQAREPYGEMRDMLAKGWFVAVPDYEGPGAAYCAGVQAGHATLDGVRAVLDVGGRFGLGKGTEEKGVRAALWGYSGGAFATEFAAELATAYSPELMTNGSLVGAVVGGPAPNLTTVDMLMNDKDTTGLVVASVMGVTAQQPHARDYLVGRLKTEGARNKTAWMGVEKMSGVDALTAFANQSVYDYFTGGEGDLWGAVVQGGIDSDAVMGIHGTPGATGNASQVGNKGEGGTLPVFFYKAVADEMSPINETDQLVEKYCSRGANILYHRNTIGGHNDELWSGRLRALDFLAAVLDDTPPRNFTIPTPAEGCKTENVTVPLDVLYLLPDWWWTEGPKWR
ncbi:lipase 1 precursor [Diplogelasinospora grovesii]|uniref:Lipase 1 n=1 Tax=Diplogelasinospora grovesii TaxID=303347 RepID=A0AAN6N001_9PEZI|nr:lipase 1 precursor [Diplogelasinospora grovesii]